MSTFTVPTLRQIAASAFAAAVSDLEDESDYINLIETLKTFPPAYLKRVIPEMPWLGIRCLWQSGSFSEYLTSEAMTDAVRREENIGGGFREGIGSRAAEKRGREHLLADYRGARQSDRSDGPNAKRLLGAPDRLARWCPRHLRRRRLPQA